MKDASKSVAIIGGADGPTSIFIGNSKPKGFSKRVKLWIRRNQHQRKRNHVKKKIVSGTHTFQETIIYMQDRYGAIEADETYTLYEQKKMEMKCSLIRRMKPELIGAEKRIERPENLSDENVLRQWYQQLMEQEEEIRTRALQISEEEFQTNYHLYLINRGEDGLLEIEYDESYPEFQTSYSGNKKVMDAILKDIYMYYGVSSEDISNNTDRYKQLIMILSS